MKIELFEAILHTGGKTVEQLRAEFGNVTDDETQGYVKILDAMDGQRAIVAPSLSDPDEYSYMGLFDQTQAKEVAYLMQQDPFMGCFIGQREEFERVWDSGEYCPDGIWALKKEQVEIIGPLQAEIIGPLQFEVKTDDTRIKPGYGTGKTLGMVPPIDK